MTAITEKGNDAILAALPWRCFHCDFVTIKWIREQQQAREQLEDAGIIINDSWQNTNTQHDDDYAARKIVETTFCDVAKFYLICGGIFAAVYGLGKWLLR
jgi:hypothetical protein